MGAPYLYRRKNRLPSLHFFRRDGTSGVPTPPRGQPAGEEGYGGEAQEDGEPEGGGAGDQGDGARVGRVQALGVQEGGERALGRSQAAGQHGEGPQEGRARVVEDRQ